MDKRHPSHTNITTPPHSSSKGRAVQESDNFTHKVNIDVKVAVDVRVDVDVSVDIDARIDVDIRIDVDVREDIDVISTTEPYK